MAAPIAAAGSGSAGQQLANSAMSGAAGSFGGAVGGTVMNWLDEALFGKKRRRQQIEQQQKLTNIQIAANKELADYGMGISKEMFEHTGYAAQRRQMEEAGLNPALMYGQAGAGGSTMAIGAGNASGSQASDEMAQKQAATQMQGMALQGAMIASQIEVNKAQANKLNADAALSGAKTKTEDQIRDILTENMKQGGMAQWYANLENEMKRNPPMKENETMIFRNETYNVYTGFQKTSYWNQEVTNGLLKSAAEINNISMNTLLVDKKVEGYWQELANATKEADAAEMQAAAAKLSAQFNAGELQNAKFWIQMSTEVIKALGSIIK